MNIAILLAGGVGKRLGAGKPKQFVELLGRPMILYALEIYEKSPSIDAAILQPSFDERSPPA